MANVNVENLMQFLPVDDLLSSVCGKVKCKFEMLGHAVMDAVSSSVYA